LQAPGRQGNLYTQTDPLALIGFESIKLKGLSRKNGISLTCGILSVLIICISVTLPKDANSLIRFDFERKTLYIPGLLVKDHSLIFHNGKFHIYFIKGNEKSFGHAVSTDLRHWQVEDDVLFAGPGDYDAARIWAPQVIHYSPNPSYFFMYYTGVNTSIAQRTALAISYELISWSKASSIFTPLQPDTSWTEWNDTSWSNFRDPYIFTDQDTLYMLNTVKTKDGYGAISLHWSTDYLNWHDAGPLFIHDNWHVLESTCMIKYDNKYRLFFTEEEVGGVSYMYSDNLKTGWDITKRMIIDAGHAAEITPLDCGKFLISRHTSSIAPSGELISTIKIDTLTWSQDIPTVITDDSFSDNWAVLWGDAFNNQPVFGNNPSFRMDTTTVGFEGNWWIGTFEGYGGPLSGTRPGDTIGDGAKGAIRSKEFTVTGWSMKLLVGGGYYPDSCYVALVDARTGKIIYRETGKNCDRMDERIWDLKPVRGKRVYIEIVDNCSSPFGHINVDRIVESNEMCDDVPGDYSGILIPDKGMKKIVSSEKVKSANPPQPALITCYPNPFNPLTTIKLKAQPNTHVELDIFNIAGKKVKVFNLTTDTSGNGSVTWDGKDDNGKPMPSGIYFITLLKKGKIIAKSKVAIVR